MCVLDAPNKTFRLVVQLDDCELVRDSLRFTQYKRALSHVATAIRDHGYDGALHEVILQQADPFACVAVTSHVDVPASEPWVDVERWGPDVVRRILAQDRLQHGKRLPPLGRAAPVRTSRPLKPVAHRLRTESPRTATPTRPTIQAPAATPVVTPPASTPAKPAPAPVVSTQVRHKPHRSRAWYIGIVFAIVAGTWISVLACMCGGQPGNVLRALEMREPPADAEAIAFDGPVILREPDADKQ